MNMKRLFNLYNKNERLVVGLMSGTSADGIDAAIVKIKGGGVQSKVSLIAFETIPYTFAIRQEILAACSPAATVEEICSLNFKLGELFAVSVFEVCKAADVDICEIDIIGSHGQTIRHIPGNSTLQIGESAVIAERTGVITVADFRVRDVAAGGQGAPLVPYSEFLLYRDGVKSRLLQNIGGIANVTLLPANCSPEDVLAFDTGPGNMMIDACIGILTDGRKNWDNGGEMAASGVINNQLLAELMSHPYLSKLPPKTTGREDFGREYTLLLVEKYLRQGIAPVDLLASFTAFTALSIADSYKRFIFPVCAIDEIIISGGGSHNNTLVTMLKKALPNNEIMLQEQLGFSADAKEAIAFALLANETVNGFTNNLPSVTGAAKPVIMGKISL